MASIGDAGGERESVAGVRGTSSGDDRRDDVRRRRTVQGSSESEMAVYRMERMDVHEGVDEVEWIRVETTGEEMPRARRGASVTPLWPSRARRVRRRGRRGTIHERCLDLRRRHPRVACGEESIGYGSGASRRAHGDDVGSRDAVDFRRHGRSTKCYDSLYALDLTQGKWTTVTPKGVRPPPRAGHAGVLLRDGRFWALVGGGTTSAD